MKQMDVQFLMVLLFLFGAAGLGALGQEQVDENAVRGRQQSRRPERFYKWPLSQIRGDKISNLDVLNHAPSKRQRRRRRDAAVLMATGMSPDSSGMRYWTKGLKNASPTPLPPTDRFISFSPWLGGFNNIRMSLEIALALAMATNRTLVLPDKYKMYKLPGVSAWSDFFDLEDMARGVPIMHQKEFQAKFGLPNKTGKVQFPKAPKRINRGFVEKGWQGIWEISRGYGFGEDELGADLAVGMIYCVPDCPKPGSEFYDEFQVYRKGRMPYVDTSSWDVAPDDKPDYKNIVHFASNGLGHWYTSIFIRPKALDLQHKEAMKNHCHFNDNIFDYAERILHKILSLTPSFSCMHVRRGDFQFKEVWTPVNEILSNVEQLFKPGEHMWVMTEEKDPDTFFSEIKQVYEVHFLKDYLKDMLADVKPALYPMIESVVCSRARVFSGTFKSTLTGYIHRLRGYMDDIEDKNIYFNQVKFPDGYGKDWSIGIGTKYPTWIHARGIMGKGVPAWAREYREVWDMEWNTAPHKIELPATITPMRRRGNRNKKNNNAKLL